MNLTEDDLKVLKAVFEQLVDRKLEQYLNDFEERTGKRLHELQHEIYKNVGGFTKVSILQALDEYAKGLHNLKEI